MDLKSTLSLGPRAAHKPTPARPVLFKKEFTILAKKEVTPDQLSRKFSANLKLLREGRDFNKSELAKELWGTQVDKRGYTVSRNRDRIGAWELERSKPTPENIEMLAEYFDVDPNLLAPDLVVRTSSASPEAMYIRILENNPQQAHLQINTLLPTSVAVQVMQLVTGAQKQNPGSDDGEVNAPR